MSARRDSSPGARQADRRRAARAARLVQVRRHGASGCSSRPTSTDLQRLPGRARSGGAGDGARPRLQPDRARRRRAGRGGAARQALRHGRAAGRDHACAAAAGRAASSSPPPRATRGSAGVEFLRSIPGTVGGFVRMNGGAYGREVKDILVDCEIVLRIGRAQTLGLGELGYTYRHSELPEGASSSPRPSAAMPRRPASDPGRDGPDRRRARGSPAAAQPHRRLDLQEPARHQGLAG